MLLDFQCFAFEVRKMLRFFVKNIAEKFGGLKKVRIFAARLRNNRKFIDKFEKR